MDRILIQELLVRCILGLTAEERREKQDVLISVVLFSDLNKPGQSDRFEDTVDYRAINKEILAAAEGSQYHLVEALAERVAETCLAHRAVQRVQVRVEKPGALRFARSVAVEIDRNQGWNMPRVFVSIGSNVDPEENAIRALRLLDEQVGIRAVSTFYRTPALNRPDDPPFVNGVIEVGGGLSAADLKARLKVIERALGREPNRDRYGPRTVDLDLLLYGNQMGSSNDLTLPHPDIRERAFVAIPLLELAPDLVLPDSGKPLHSLVDALPHYPMEPLVDLTRRLRMEVRR